MIENISTIGKDEMNTMNNTKILNQNTASVLCLCRKDKRLAKVISMVGEITYQTYTDSYAFLVQQIIGQMLSNKAADKICKRLKDLCDNRITLESIQALSDEQIKSVGTSASKVSYIRCLTKAVLDKQIIFEEFPDMTDQEIVKKLTLVHGIGKWSAKMYLIFVLDRQDVLPLEDVAFLQGYQWMYKIKDMKSENIEKRCKKWSPYASIAARYLYRALDMGLTKEEFHLYK